MRDRLVGKTLGDFHIEAQLGSGAMGKVYRATQISLRRSVALKVLEEGLFTPDEFKVRFRREAEYIARLEHPHIVSIYQSGHQDNYTWYAMRLVEGKSLDHLLAEGLALRTGLRYLADIAGALGYAHGHKVIHRDVKPANIMISGGVAYLADFGLARLLETSTITGSGVLLGTLLYMAPEQVRRERAAEASDIWALGVIVYELATGRHPFAGDGEGAAPGSGPGRVETMERIAGARFAPPAERLPGLPPLLQEIILRAMALAPESRYATARDLQKDLQRAQLLPELDAIDGERAKVIGRPIRPSSTAPATASEPAPPTVVLPESPPPEAVRRIGGYRLLEEQGRAADRVIHRAVEESRNRAVALHLLNLPMPTDPDALARFRMAAASAAALRHPGILAPSDTGAAEGNVFFATDPVEGETLDRILERERLSVRRALEIARDVARVLEYAHAQGILHRDLRPERVWIDPAGRVRVADFALAGIARDEGRDLTRGGELPRGVAYLAPEQVRGRRDALDARTDVYALGALFYAMLTGRAPFEAGNVVARVLADPPPEPRLLAPRVHPDAEAICLRALAKDPGARYPSASVLAVDLEALLQGEAISLRPVARIDAWMRVLSRRRRAVGALAIAGLVALGGSVWWTVRSVRAARARESLARAAIDLRLGDAAGAEERVGSALAAAPDLPAAWYWRTRILCRRRAEKRRLAAVRVENDRLAFVDFGPDPDAGLEAEIAEASVRSRAGSGLSAAEAEIADGLGALSAGRLEEAARLLDHACDGPDADADVFAAAAEAAYRAANFAAALESARAGLARARGDERLSEAQARAQVATAWQSSLRGGDPRPGLRAAIAVCERQEALGSTDVLWPALRAEALRGIGAHEAKIGGDFETVLTAALEALPAGDSLEGWLARGDIRLTLGDARRARGADADAGRAYTQALESFERALALAPDSRRAREGREHTRARAPEKR